MSGPQVASTNEAIDRAQGRQLEQAERHLREMLAAFLTHPPVATHRDNLVRAIDGHRELRIRDGFAEREARAEAVRVVR